MREKNQVVLPLDLGICIPEGDFVLKVAEICESLDYTELFNTYLRNWRKVNPITLKIEDFTDPLFVIRFFASNRGFFLLTFFVDVERQKKETSSNTFYCI